MKDETSKKSMHEQVLATNSNTTFRPEPTTSSIFNIMGKSLNEVLSLGSPAMNRLRGARGSTVDSESTSTVSTPVASPYMKAGGSSTGGDANTGSPIPPAKPPRIPPNSPTPGLSPGPTSPTPSSPAPRMGGLLRSVSAFVTSSASTLRGNASTPIPSSSSPTAIGADKGLERFSLDNSTSTPSAAVDPEELSVRSEMSYNNNYGLTGTDPLSDTTTIHATTTTTIHPLSPPNPADTPPPLKPPKPNRRTNICITIDPDLLEQHQQKEGDGEES